MALSVLVARVLMLVAVVATPVPDYLLTRDSLIARVTELNKQALAEIDRGALTSARKHLLEAERFASRSELGNHPLVARTYLHLGTVEILVAGPSPRVEELFARAVAVQPDIQMTRSLAARADVIASAAPALEKARCVSDRSNRWTCPWTDDVPNPDLPAKVAPLVCPSRDEVPEATPVPVRCAANPELAVAKLTLFYGDSAPTAKFSALAMDRDKRGWWTATIPAKRVSGKSIKFYAEATDADGHRVASSGEERQPWIMLVHSPRDCWCKTMRPDEEARLQRP